MERGVELFRLTSFVTKDLKSFEKKKIKLWSSDDRIPVVGSDRVTA
jgi:hypothetical protein